MKTPNSMPAAFLEGIRGRYVERIRCLQVRGLVALICALLLAPGDRAMYAQQPQQPAQQEAPKIPNDQLDSLVAPIALYPDPLLAQVLAASTYPLEVIQLQQWLQMHKDLKEKALVDAVQKEDWDPSIQGLAALPDAVKQLAENIKWTTDLGNAFLAQQSDVMDAVQRMRMKADKAGTLKSSEQQKVETKVVESKTVVVIEQANPQVIYVPSYNPVVVYGGPVYPYPVIIYPPPPPAGVVIATAAISFGIGMAIGAAWGGGWGYGCGWGHYSSVNINVHNHYVSHYNSVRVSHHQTAISGGNWQHNPQHRGGAPYPSQGLANRYGGTTRGASVANRQAGVRPNQGVRQQPAALKPAGVANRQQPVMANRAGGGADRIGNRSVPSGGSTRGAGAFGGGSGGFNGSSARANSARGASSMGSRGGGRRK